MGGKFPNAKIAIFSHLTEAKKKDHPGHNPSL
jgi:hypothetical protein